MEKKMFKKIVLASFLAVTASFASWDLFPVLPQQQGELQLGLNYFSYNNSFRNYKNGALEPYNENSLTARANIRYAIISNLEFALSMPYRVYTEVQGSDASVYGFGNIGMSVRYQFTHQMNAFFDAEAPAGDESFNYEDVWNFFGGLQFSTPFNSLVNFGSQVGLNLATRGKRDASNIGLNVSAETDFTAVQHITPYLRANLNVDLGTFNSDGYELSEGGDIGTWITMGSKFDLSKKTNLDVYYGIGIGDHYYGTDSHNFGVNLNVKF